MTHYNSYNIINNNTIKLDALKASFMLKFCIATSFKILTNFNVSKASSTNWFY